MAIAAARPTKPKLYQRISKPSLTINGHINDYSIQFYLPYVFFIAA
jgi:hypothetical protein